MLMEEARRQGERVRITYGDVSTGRKWEDKPVTGTLGRTTGDIKIPILLKQSRSIGGEAILTHCIVKLEIQRYGKHYLPFYQTLIDFKLKEAV